MKTILKMIMIGGAFALQAQELKENNIDSRIKSLHEQLRTAWGFESVVSEKQQDFMFYTGGRYTWHIVSVNKKALEARNELFSLTRSGTLSENQMNAVLDALEMGLANPFQGYNYNGRKNDRKSEATLRFRVSIFRRLGYLAIDPFVPMTIANRDQLIDLLSAPLYDQITPLRQYKGISAPRNFQLAVSKNIISTSHFLIDPLREAATESLEKIAQSELLFSREKIEPLMERVKELLMTKLPERKVLSPSSWLRSKDSERSFKVNAGRYRNILYHFQNKIATIKELEAQRNKTYGNETVLPKTEVVPQPEPEESTNLLE